MRTPGRGAARRSAGPLQAGAILMTLLAILPGDPATARSPERPATATGHDAGAVVRAVIRPGELRVGQTFTVDIRARRLRGAGAAAFHLIYDPELVEPVPSGFSEGPALGRGGAATSFLAAPASTGDRVMVGVARLGGTQGARGAGLLCRLTFRALQSGTATFAFDRAQISGAGAARLPAAFRPGQAEILPTRPGRKGEP